MIDYEIDDLDSSIDDEQEPWIIEPETPKYNLKPNTFLLENDSIVAINKPAGLLTTPDRYAAALPNLYGILKEKYGEIFIVHRIDKETSGVVLFSKTEDAHKDLSQQFENREVEKTYLALVDGRLENKEGEIDSAITEDSRKAGRVTIDPVAGKPSVTRYKVIQEFKKFSLVEVMPLTGRQHQIRIHFKSIGHSLAVDPFYGQRKALMVSEFKKKYRGKEEVAERGIISRLTLHAFRLVFNDPNGSPNGSPNGGPNGSGRVTLEAPLPKDFRATINQLQRHNCI